MASLVLEPDFFIRLPSEILLTVFESQDSFRDVRSLFSTCKVLYGLWQNRVLSISNNLLVKQTACFEDTKILVMANEKARFAARHHLNLLNLDPIPDERYRTALDRLALYRRIANQAGHLCDIIQSRYLSQKEHCHSAACRAHPATLVPRESIQITRAHHFIKLYALAYGNADLTDLYNHCVDELQNMSTADKHLLHQVARIMHDYALPWEKLRLGIHSPFSPAGPIDFNTCCCQGWPEKFQAIKQATRVTVATCGDCIWDDTGMFGRTSENALAAHGDG